MYKAGAENGDVLLVQVLFIFFLRSGAENTVYYCYKGLGSCFFFKTQTTGRIESTLYGGTCDSSRQNYSSQSISVVDSSFVGNSPKLFIVMNHQVTMY